jgi:hypothetical protein
MLAAQVRGLATCPQVSFVRFQSVIAEQLGLGPDEVVTCGMSCGYEDEQAAVNHLRYAARAARQCLLLVGFRGVADHFLKMRMAAIGPSRQAAFFGSSVANGALRTLLDPACPAHVREEHGDLTALSGVLRQWHDCGGALRCCRSGY